MTGREKPAPVQRFRPDKSARQGLHCVFDTQDNLMRATHHHPPLADEKAEASVS